MITATRVEYALKSLGSNERLTERSMSMRYFSIGFLTNMKDLQEK